MNYSHLCDGCAMLWDGDVVMKTADVVWNNCRTADANWDVVMNWANLWDGDVVMGESFIPQIGFPSQPSPPPAILRPSQQTQETVRAFQRTVGGVCVPFQVTEMGTVQVDGPCRSFHHNGHHRTWSDLGMAKDAQTDGT